MPRALLLELARAWPDPVGAGALIERVFGGRGDDESYRERCRVEIARLRRLLPARAAIRACGRAWRLAVPDGTAVAVVELLAPDSTLTALLADGEAWAARDLAQAIGASQRSVQRALRELAEAGEVRAVGNARARRWVAPGASLTIAAQMFVVSLLDPRGP